MTPQRLFPVLAAIALAALVACGGGDDADDDGDSEPTGSGSDPTAAADAADLGDFAVPLPGWAEAVTPNIGGGGLDVVLFTVPLDQRDATVEFYADWTNAQSEAFLRTDSESGGVSFQGDVAVGEEKTTISILSPLGGDDFVSVSLSRGVFE